MGKSLNVDPLLHSTKTFDKTKQNKIFLILLFLILLNEDK